MNSLEEAPRRGRRCGTVHHKHRHRTTPSTHFDREQRVHHENEPRREHTRAAARPTVAVVAADAVRRTARRENWKKRMSVAWTRWSSSAGRGCAEPASVPAGSSRTQPRPPSSSRASKNSSSHWFCAHFTSSKQKKSLFLNCLTSKKTIRNCTQLRVATCYVA